MLKNNFLSYLRPSMLWAIWLFPFCAVVISGFIFYDYFEKQGPSIQITFPDAAGIESFKTQLRFRGINVGKVENILLSQDTKEVVVEARLTRDAQHLATEGARFYIVQPQVDFEGVHGLETLFKGPYIRIEQGKNDGKKQLIFRGHSDGLADAPGTVPYFLHTKMVNSIDAGDAVSFRGLKIGSVSAVKLDTTAQGIDIQINIDRQYTKLIRENSMFWPKIGVYAKLGLFASELKINSFESLLKGGIDVATPSEAGKIAAAQHIFQLAEQPPKAWEAWSPSL